MAGTIDLLAREKQVGNKGANTLRKDFKDAIRDTVTVRGESRNATVRPKYREGRLDRLTFIAKDYIFKQHYGFEGAKSNGVNMRLQATYVLNRALNKSKVIDTLADELADIRGEEVLLKMNFNGGQQ